MSPNSSLFQRRQLAGPSVGGFEPAQPPTAQQDCASPPAAATLVTVAGPGAHTQDVRQAVTIGRDLAGAVIDRGVGMAPACATAVVARRLMPGLPRVTGAATGTAHQRAVREVRLGQADFRFLVRHLDNEEGPGCLDTRGRPRLTDWGSWIVQQW